MLTLQPTSPRLARLQVDPVLNADGTLQHFAMQAFFTQDLVDDSTTPPTVTPQAWTGPVTIRCVADGVKDVATVLGNFTYAHIAESIMAAAAQERDMAIASSAKLVEEVKNTKLTLV